MTKSNITHIILSLITSLFLFVSVLSVSYAAPSEKKVSVSIKKGETVKQVVNHVTRALKKKGYELKAGNAKHIAKVAHKGVVLAARGGRPRITCDYIIFNCRMENL